jgi:hypothetical protein
MMPAFPLALLVALVVLVATGCGQKADPPVAPVAVQVQPDLGGPVAAPGERIDNPQYASWAKFPVGTVTVVRTTSETEGVEGKTVTTTTTRLLELTPDAVKLETQTKSRRYDGYEESNPPNTTALPAALQLPPGVKKEDIEKPAVKGEEGEESVTVGGRQYAARWYKNKDRNEGGEVSVTTWVSPDVPGRLLKSVSRTSGVKKLVTVELIELKRP